MFLPRALRGLKRNGHFRCFAVSDIYVGTDDGQFFSAALFGGFLRLKSCFFTSFAADFPFITIFGEHDAHEKSFWKNIKYFDDPIAEAEELLSKSERMPR